MSRIVLVLLIAAAGCAGKPPEQRSGDSAVAARAGDSATRARRDSMRRDSLARHRAPAEEDPPCFASHLGLPCSG